MVLEAQAAQAAHEVQVVLVVQAVLLAVQMAVFMELIKVILVVPMIHLRVVLIQVEEVAAVI